jgi:DNA-binding transcriptional ArsR family regulator
MTAKCISIAFILLDTIYYNHYYNGMINHVKTSHCASSGECLTVLQALSDKTRQEVIVIFTYHKELCANDIAKQFSLSRPTISHHLNLMKRVGILNARKDGKEVYYSLNKSKVIGLLETMIKSLKKCC